MGTHIIQAIWEYAVKTTIEISDPLLRKARRLAAQEGVTLGAGVIENTPDNLRAWIRDPQAIKPGVLMPAFPSLSPSDLGALVDYLESLK